jgi:GT2 family glycosyltransferase
MARPFVTVVVCSIDAEKYERCTARYRALLGHADLELFGIHDARSLASAYNWAARRAHGALIAFSHDDVEALSPDFASALERAAAALDVIGVAGTSRVVDGYWPRAGHPHLHGWLVKPGPGDGFTVNVYGVDGAITHGLQGLDGMFIAAKPEVLAQVGFDEATFDGFHGYDLDFTFRANRAGFRVGTSAELAMIHASSGGYDASWTTYNARFVAKHGELLATPTGARSWGIGVFKVPTREDVLTAFPLAQLQKITASVRAVSTRAAATR